jgi:hypothetical protein
MKNTQLLKRLTILSLILIPVFGCTKKSETTTAPATTEHDHAAAPVAGFEAAPENAKVFFDGLKDSQTVAKKFTVKFGVDGMKIHPAGEIISGTGHHHLIVDGAAVAEGHVVPTDETHIHFGLGQTETELELAPGKHSLTLQFANGAHVSYGPKMSATINVTVE